MLFTQEHLAQARQAAEAKLQEAVQINKEFADKYEHLRQENRKRKHLIASYNRMVDNTATGGPSTVGSLGQEGWPCHCTSPLRPHVTPHPPSSLTCPLPKVCLLWQKLCDAVVSALAHGAPAPGEPAL